VKNTKKIRKIIKASNIRHLSKKKIRKFRVKGGEERKKKRFRD
jgi:hypothetical protein